MMQTRVRLARSGHRPARRATRTLLLSITALLSVTVGAVASPPAPPPNDNRDSASPVTLPSTVTGTTAGSTVETNEPPSGCGRSGGSVWYSVTVGGSPPSQIGVRVSANGDLDAVVDVYQRQRSQNIPVDCQATDADGLAGLSFQPSAHATYLIRVAQRSNSVAGTFSLKVFVPPAPPSPPGAVLSARGAHGVLDGIFRTEAAYSMALRAGTTYKLNLVDRADGCMSLALYPPGSSSFDGAGSVAGLDCAGYRLFTPRISGRWSFLVTAASENRGSQPYALHVARASGLEMAPGISLPNFGRYRGLLRGNVIDDVRLFRFDVTTRSDLTLSLRTTSSQPFDLKLLSDRGRVLECECGSAGDETLQRQTAPGRYFVVVQAEDFGWGRFTLSRQSRVITHVRVSFDGFGYEQIAPGRSTRITATVSPAVTGPVTFEVEYFDPVGRWQFRGDYNVQAVGGVAVLPFTPPSVGRWRATVVYNGTRSAAPAQSGWANLLVAGPLTQ